MSKILLTGMTASQSSSSANKRTRGFAGQIAQGLSIRGHTVDWIDPSVNMDIDALALYDAVLVGVAPVTSLGANRAYGALSVIQTMFDDPRLRLFLDAPNPQQITHSLRAILKRPDDINKPFYSYRKEYSALAEHSTKLRVYSAIRNLAYETWPETLRPSLPWAQEAVEPVLPSGAAGQVRDVNLDAFDIARKSFAPQDNVSRWVTDGLKSKWIESHVKTLENPVEDFKSNRFTTDDEVELNMSSSIGALIAPPVRAHTWWSHRYAQALRVGIPVVTEWREAGKLDSSWSVLSSQIEQMSDERRFSLAKEQKAAYLDAVNVVDDEAFYLEGLLGLNEMAL